MMESHKVPWFQTTSQYWIQGKTLNQHVPNSPELGEFWRAQLTKPPHCPIIVAELP